MVKVSIGRSFGAARDLRLAQRAVPVRQEVTALIDTGAEITCVDPRLIEELGLPFEGAVVANVPALEDTTFAFQYDASVKILHPSGLDANHLIVTDMPVMELPLNVLGYQVLIGRDVLKHCMLLYNGLRERFTLKY
ncbi:MAG: retroviral-like aspartic protease [Planctomycetes bacterium]|nr:retroviral-like aspartic protease [Planctomycetota bacterium]